MAADAAWRNRITRHADVPPAELVAHPLNARRHPKHQQNMRANCYNCGNADSVGVSSETLRTLREIPSTTQQPHLFRLSPRGQQEALPHRGLRGPDRLNVADVPAPSAGGADLGVLILPGVCRPDAREYAGLSSLPRVDSGALCVRLRPVSSEVRRVGAGAELYLRPQRQLAGCPPPARGLRHVWATVQGLVVTHLAVRHRVPDALADGQPAEREEARPCALRGLRRRGDARSASAATWRRRGVRENLSIHPGREQAEESAAVRHEAAGIAPRRGALSGMCLRSRRPHPPYPAALQGRLGCAGEPDYALPEPSRHGARRLALGRGR